jgi:hypothetical protein
VERFAAYVDRYHIPVESSRSVDSERNR